MRALWVSVPACWLVSTFQLSGTPDLYFYKPNNIITSILPRQEEREREKQRKRECVCLDERACRGSGAEEQAQASNQESTSEREDAVDA